MIIPLRLDPEVPEEAAVIQAYKARPPRRRQEFMRRLIIQALRAVESPQLTQPFRDPIFSQETPLSQPNMGQSVDTTPPSNSSSNIKGIF